MFLVTTVYLFAGLIVYPAQSQIFAGGGGNGNMAAAAAAAATSGGHAFLSSLDNVGNSLSRIRNQATSGGGLQQQQQQQQQDQQQVSSVPLTLLEAPHPFQPHPFVQGSSAEGQLDLLAFNRRKFEKDHQHKFHGGSSDYSSELKRGEVIEANLMALPERVLSQLPDEMSKQIFETMSADPALMMGAAMMSGGGGGGGGGSGGGHPQPLVDQQSEDPEGASIERLTKSCMTVHASSALPEQLNVTFHLYTRKNLQVPYLVWPQITRLDLLKGSPFDPTKPIKWITHGFHTNIDKSEWMVETKDKILAYEDANVFLTDWRRGSSPALAFYPKAAANAHVVAKMIVNILRRLKQDIDFSNIHLIGHSLGAHIMGFVGSAFTEEYLHFQQQELAARQIRGGGNSGSRGKFSPAQLPPNFLTRGNTLIDRITACDPALPCFGPTSSGPNSRNGHPAVVQVIPAPQANGSAHLMPQVGQPTSGVSSQLLSEVVTDWTPTMWTHLRPDSAIVVEVMHSNPGVMGYAEPLGDYDFYPNGFERQPGCGNQQTGGRRPEKRQSRSRSIERTKRQAATGSESGGGGNKSGGFMGTLDRFIKPLRDFFQGYTCSHHRSVEYMVESMYYERVPQERKLDREQVCQMVGYRCPDYASFKRGFCFKCQNDLDCRTFLMPTSTIHQQPPPVNPISRNHSRLLIRRDETTRKRSASPGQGLEKFWRTAVVLGGGSSSGNGSQVTLVHGIIESSNSESIMGDRGKKNLNNSSNHSVYKRILPTYNPYEGKYLPPRRNQYYFDTKPNKEFCLHHYHILVKYKWFRVRESVSLHGFVLSGLLGNIIVDSPITLNRFTYQSYTLLITHDKFLGQLDALTVFGDKIKPTLVEYIEITYMSNSDPRIRALGSARLCRSQGVGSNNNNNGDSQRVVAPPPPTATGGLVAANEAFMMSGVQAASFTRCAGSMV